jgi:hypothetical protein
MMKYLSLFLLFMISLSFFFYSALTLQAQEREIELSIENYFEYLRRGDTESILSLLTDPLLSEKRELLEKNTEYPESLRETYENASMLIKSVKMIDTQRGVADVEIYFDGQASPLKIRFILKRKDGSWKISEEVSNG